MRAVQANPRIGLSPLIRFVPHRGEYGRPQLWRYDREGEIVVRAAVVEQFHQPLRIEDMPVPIPGHGQVLVKVETSGLCHTDIHAAHGDWPVKPVPPFIPGHEKGWGWSSE